MTFTLSAELEELIRRKVKAGSYESPAQVIEEALQLLEERDILREVRRDRLVRSIASGAFEADNRQLVDADQVLRGLMIKASTSDQ